MFLTQVAGGFDNKFTLCEEDSVEIGDPEAEEKEHRKENFNLIVGASVVRDLEQASQNSEDTLLSYAAGPGANIEKILRAARQYIYDHYLQSRRQMFILIFAGIGELATSTFDAVWMMSKIRGFLDKIDEFTTTFGIENPPVISFAKLYYPIGTRHSDEIDMFNENIHIICASRKVEPFELGELFYREPLGERAGNVVVKGVEMYSPVSFWRKSGDIHPDEKRLRDVDEAVRKFFAREFQVDFRTARNVLGIETTRRRRTIRKRELDRSFSKVTGEIDEHAKKMRKEPVGPKLHVPMPGTSGAQGVLNFQEIIQEQKAEARTQRREEKESGEKRYGRTERPGIATLGDFVQVRTRRTRWSSRERESHFEDRIKDLPEEVQQKRREEREDRINRTREREQERLEKHRRKQEEEKEECRKRMVDDYRKAKRGGNEDLAARLFASLASMGVDIDMSI